MKVKFTTELTRKQFTILTGGLVFMMGSFFTGVKAQSPTINDNMDLPYKKVVEQVSIEPVETTEIIINDAQPLVVEIVEPIVEIKELVERKYYRIPEEFTAIGGDFPEEIQDFLWEICEERNLDFYILTAQIEAESSYKSNTIGDNGASIGYMQIQKKWHKKRMESEGVDDLHNPKANIKVGTNYLKELYEKYEGDWHKTLMAYNMGETKAKELWRLGKYSSEYSIKIINRAEEIKQELLQEAN